MTAAVYRLPVADNRLAGMAASPVEAVALIRHAVARAEDVAGLIRQAAPAAEVTAAAEALAAAAALVESLAMVELTASIFDAIYRAARADQAASRSASRASRSRLHTVPGGAAPGSDTPRP